MGHKNTIALIIDSEIVENGLLYKVQVASYADMKSTYEETWGLRIKNDKGKNEWMRKFILNIDWFSETGFSRDEMASKLVQFRYDLMDKYGLAKIDDQPFDIYNVPHSLLSYPESSYEHLEIHVCEVLKTLLQNKGGIISIDCVFLSVKADRQSVDKVLRKIDGFGIIKLDEGNNHFSAGDEWFRKLDDYMSNKLDNKAPSTAIQDQRVFIVHGHNNLWKEAVKDFIASLDLEPIILHEQPSQGMSIAEKLEHHSDVKNAIVILSGDDRGRPNRVRTSKSRARQNVVFELGYFWGKLGRRNVIALYEKGVELPSDIHGVLIP